MALSDLNFERGLEFEKSIWKDFDVPINNDDNSPNRDFIMVLVVRRSRLRINDETVGLILQSCFGGSAIRFKASRLMNLSFKFCVSCRSVGFSLMRGGNIATDLFNIEFFSGELADLTPIGNSATICKRLIVSGPL